jgi:predicted ATPase
MTTQQPPEPSSHDAQYRVINIMHITAFLRKQVPQQQERQQGVVICGGSGVGKTVAVEVFFSAEDKEDK